jgi:type II secretory pathway predicted ATPase ExeA
MIARSAWASRDAPGTAFLTEIILTLELPLKVEVKGSMLHERHYYLIRSLEQNENVVIIIDEAHNISLEAIEESRSLRVQHYPTIP